jgi:ABC-type branched-subunit amino acid transport system substrate-binding protein
MARRRQTKQDSVDEPLLTRREALKRLGVGATVVAAGPSFLAACGSSAKKAASAGGASSTTGSTAAPSDVGQRLATMLGIDKATAGAGITWQMGNVLALTGNGSFYGKTMSRGTDLAVKHIKAAGGPDIKVIYKDHKSGDAQAGAQAITELGTAGVPAKLASYVDDLGAMLAGTAQYKMFTLDGGGGTSIFGQGKPYFWGTRAITPNDALPGLLMYVKATLPSAKTIGLTGWDIGEPSNGQIKKDVLKRIGDGGFTYNGLYELFPPNSTDFGTILPKIAANQPDVLLVGAYGQDPGFFLNQSLTSGIKSAMFGFEFTPDGIKASKGTYDSQGWTFAYDYFDPDHPVSPLAKLFTDEFVREYGEKPDFYAADFYENTLVMWEMIRRVLKKGGNVNSGPDLDAALRDNPTVVSVYGGDASTVGTYTLDLTTHSVNKRGMGVFQYKGGHVTPKAFYGINGDNFHKA